MFESTGHQAFEVAFIDGDQTSRREPLAACWTEKFERSSPVRMVKTYRGQKSVTHVYWSATTSCSIVCESHLERHHAMLLDFDASITGIVGQPFRLFWPGARGRRGHVPLRAGRVDVHRGDHSRPGDRHAQRLRHTSRPSVRFLRRRYGGSLRLTRALVRLTSVIKGGP